MRNNKIYFRLHNSKAIKEYRFDNIKNYPNIPLYVHFWDDHRDYPTNVGNFLRDEVFQNNYLLDRFYPKEMYVLLPDDTQALERRAIEEFFMQSIKPKKVVVAFECHYMNLNKVNYISIAETCRMLVLTRIEDGVIKGQSFLEKKTYEIEELKKHIRSLSIDYDMENVHFYLNESGLNSNYSMGTIVPYENILDNFIIKNTQ